MPFSTTASVISTDLDNMVRGLYRDNSDTVLTNTLVETTLKSMSIGGGTIGATGAIHLRICGTLAGTAGTKTMRLSFGGVLLATVTQAAGTTTDWFFDAWCFNTATGAQRWFIYRNTNDALTTTFDYATSSVDTTGSQTLKVTGQLGNVLDTTTGTMMDVFVVQIT